MSFFCKKPPVVTSTIILKNGDVTLVSRVTEDEVREEAYRIWQSEGCQGNSTDHWFRAKENIEKRFLNSIDKN